MARRCIWEGCGRWIGRGYYCLEHSSSDVQSSWHCCENEDVPAFDVDRYFWPKVKRGDGCWEWRGALDGSGYGKIKIQGNYYRASRVAYSLTRGNPGGQMVLHTCDNRRCVNPGHLYLGDVRRNSRDMRERGRGANRYGEFGWAWK